MLTISRREARIGRSLPFRTEEHGDESVKATDIPIEGIGLSAEELNALLQEPQAHNALFCKRPGSTLDDPLFKQFKPLQLLGKVEQANVVLFLGINGKELKLGTCKLRKIKLEPQTGGMTLMSCQVQAHPTLDKRIADLVDYMGEAIAIEIGYEHNAEQRELNMDAAKSGPGDEEDEDDDDEEAETPAPTSSPKPRRRRRKGNNGESAETH